VAGASPSAVCLSELFVSHSDFFHVIFYALFWSEHFPIITDPLLKQFAHELPWCSYQTPPMPTVRLPFHGWNHGSRISVRIPLPFILSIQILELLCVGLTGQ
jgi:hypothetical protein